MQQMLVMRQTLKGAAMLFVTFHGGKPGQHALRNNVHAYDKDGQKITSSVLDDAAGVSLNELRGLCLRGDLLYVVVANKETNEVLCYKGADTCYRFKSTFVSHATCAGILHPFDLTFDDSGFCYVSSQDTNVVTRLLVSADGHIATPAPIAPALAGKGTFLSGTFVASSVGNLSDPPTTPIAQPSGLSYSDVGEKKHSVRGVLWTNNALYVADQPAGRIKVYDKDGGFRGQSTQVESPVHLTVHNGTLFVTGGDVVLSSKLSQPAGDFHLEPVPELKIKNGSGMAFTDEGKVYLASRTENRIRKFGPDLKPIKFDCDLPDNPEFLLFVR